MKRLGITGGIGSGKTWVSRLLREVFHIPVYDCDTEAKRLMEEDETVRAQLTALVGPMAYDAEGHLNKPHLGAYLFASPQHAASVEAIVHPAVRKDFRQWCERQTSGLVALESAILYESGFDHEVDEVILVDAPEEVRLARAMQRDHASAEQIRQRMRRQDETYARQYAACIVHNDASDTEQTIVEQLKPYLLCYKPS